ncbi:hypothetical protein EVAR_88713_1 [Eumeta japonica]|uniref:Uncharacterized protein n=1 Tax=Eumeta variegata TaxID=151549 RepID=A0A4C1XFC2_EUMVA|nr:hypothetical protein EVAR_88713_1 [Eumeta japonica]
MEFSEKNRISDGEVIGPPEFPITGRNAIAEAATTRLYSARMWYLINEADPFSCCSYSSYTGCQKARAVNVRRRGRGGALQCKEMQFLQLKKKLTRIT